MAFGGREIIDHTNGYVDVGSDLETRVTVWLSDNLARAVVASVDTQTDQHAEDIFSSRPTGTRRGLLRRSERIKPD